MTTSRKPHDDYYTSDQFTYKNNQTTNIQHQNNLHADSNQDGVITRKSKNGTYNIVEKDFGDRKVIYHIPIEYGDNYDVSQLEDIPTVEEQQQQQSTNSPKLVRRRIYQEYNDNHYDNDYEYVEEIPIVTPRRHVYVSPRRQRDVQVVERIYESRLPIKTVEYIYEDDHQDVYEYKPERQQEVEYIVRERIPKQIYVEEPQPVRRTVYVEESQPVRHTVYVEEPSVPRLSPPPPSPPPPPPPPPPPHSPRRSPYQPSPRSNFNQESTFISSSKPVRRNNISPPPSTRRQPPSRSSQIYESIVKPNIPKTNEPPLRLMDVIAQNRAKRGSRIPKPRREIDEETVHDPPTYNRNLIKNGFIVHK